MTYEEFLHKVENITEDTVSTVGYVATRIAPLWGPLVSGIAIVFAFYDGGGALLVARHIPYAYTIALTVGLFVAFSLEGLTITHMVLGDRVRSAIKRNAALSGILDITKADGNKRGLLWFTLVAILMLETVPAAAELYAGAIKPEVALFRMGLIVFPWLSRNAASAYSLLRLLDEVDDSESKSRAERRQRKIRDRLDEQEILAEYGRKRQLEDAKLTAKLEKVSVKSTVKPTENFTPSTSGEPVKFYSVDSENFTDQPVENFTPSKVDLRRQALLDLMAELDGKEIEALNKSALAKRLDVSRPTLLSDLAALQDSGKLSLNGHVRVRQ